MDKPICPCDINASMNRGNPCRAGKWPHNASGSKNRQATFDAKAGIPCFQRNFCPIRNRNFNDDIARAIQRRCQLVNCLSHHLARNRIDRRFANSNWQTRFGDQANSIAAGKGHSRLRQSLTQTGNDHRPMRDIRIITSILYDACLRPILALIDKCYFQIGLFATRGDHADAFGKCAGYHCRIGRIHRCCCTGAGGPAEPQVCRQPFRHIPRQSMMVIIA